MLTAHDPVARALAAAVLDQGRSLLNDPVRLRAVLSDLLGAEAARHRARIDALCTAAGAGAGRAVIAGAVPDDPRLQAVLVSAGLSREAAAWASVAMTAALAEAEAAAANLTDAAAGARGRDSPLAPGPPADPGATRIGAGRPGSQVSGGTSATAGDVPRSPEPRRRVGWGAAAVVVAVVLALAAGVGVGLWTTRGEPDSARRDAGAAATVVVAGTTPTTTVTGTPSTVEVLTSAVTTAPTTVTRTVFASTVREMVSGRDTVAVSDLCTPLSDVGVRINGSINGWADSDLSAAAAKKAAAEFAAAANTMTAVLRKATATGSEVPLVVLQWRRQVLNLQRAVAAAQQGSYSDEAFTDALRGNNQARSAFNDACEVASGGVEPFTTNQNRVAAACRSLALPLAAAKTAVRQWSASNTADTASAAAKAITALRPVLSDVGPKYRIAMAHRLRAAAEALDLRLYNLGLLADGRTAPYESWIVDFNAQIDAVEAVC